MLPRRRICVVTGGRADYGLLRQLIEPLSAEPAAQLQLLVTGSHLSQAHGLSIEQIRADGFTVDACVDMVLASDSAVAISKSMGLGLIGFADAFERLRPDIVVVLGDRYEIWAAASACLIQQIPLAHIHGGEQTSGAFDEAVRHSITKMAHYHFTAAEPYRQRVIQLGEQPDRVFNTGGLGVDAIRRMTLLDRAALETDPGIRFGRHNLMVTFHPVTLDAQGGLADCQALLSALDELESTQITFTEANADTLGLQFNRLIAEFVAGRPEQRACYSYLGQLRYLSLMKQVDVVLGNSSSGVIEAPVLGTPTVNIGERQAGRLRASTVIDCQSDKASIRDAIGQALSMKQGPVDLPAASPFGEGKAASTMTRLLLELPLENLLMKRFHDIGETV